MAKKSNKTAHVLNLISSAKSASEPKEEPQENTSATISEDAAASAEPSSIQTSLSQSSKNEELSEKIHDNLLAEFENAFSDTSSKNAQMSEDSNISDISDIPDISEDSIQSEIALSPQDSNDADSAAQNVDDEKTTTDDTSSSATSIQPENAETTLEDIETAPQNMQAKDALQSDDTIVPQETTDHASSVETETESQISTENTAENAQEDALSTVPHFVFVNICEELVKEKTVEYLERFGVCTCSRCVADTMALALSHIQPKYVVMDPDTAVPFLSYYANKLSVNVMTELTKACLTVLAHPRHDPEEAKRELEQQAKQNHAE